MPNWVRNIIRMDGIASKPLFVLDDEGNKHFDFNKLIPMPEALDVPNGSATDENIVYYLTERCSVPIGELAPDRLALMNGLVGNMFTGSGWPEEVFRRVAARASGEAEAERQQRYDAGKRYVDNYKLYGAATWYEWRCREWGTKWNACGTQVENDDTIIFDTAWSNPEPILLKLAEMYPEAEIEHWWADEGIEDNAGHRRLHGSEVVEEPRHQDDRA